MEGYACRQCDFKTNSDIVLKRHIPTCVPKEAKDAKSGEMDPMTTAKDELVQQLISGAEAKVEMSTTKEKEDPDIFDPGEEMDLHSDSDAESKPLRAKRGKRKAAPTGDSDSDFSPKKAKTSSPKKNKRPVRKVKKEARSQKTEYSCCSMNCVHYGEDCFYGYVEGLQNGGSSAKVHKSDTFEGGVEGLLRMSYHDNRTTDLTLVAEGGVSIPCHSVVFAMVSNFTRGLIEACPDVSEASIHLPDVSASVLNTFLARLYFVSEDTMLKTDKDMIAQVLRIDSHPCPDTNEYKKVETGMVKITRTDEDFVEPDVKGFTSFRMEEEVNGYEDQEEMYDYVSDYDAPPTEPSSSNKRKSVIKKDKKLKGQKSKCCSMNCVHYGEECFNGHIEFMSNQGKKKKDKEKVEKEKEEKEEKESLLNQGPCLCPLCGKVCTGPRALTYHMNEHEGIEPYKCNTCDFKSASKAKLDRHKHKEHNPDSDLPTCSLCPEPLRENHMENHHGKNRYSCNCCSYGASSMKDIETHQLRYHREQVMTKCDQCASVLAKQSMFQHKKNHHDPSLPYACDECEYRSSTKGSIVQHKRLQHHVGERFECTNGCGKTFADKEYLYYHAKKHCSKRDKTLDDLPTKEPVSQPADKSNITVAKDSKKQEPEPKWVPSYELCSMEVLAIKTESELATLDTDRIRSHASSHGISLKDCRIAKHSGTIKLISAHYNTHHDIHLIRDYFGSSKPITTNNDYAKPSNVEFLCPICGDKYRSSRKLEWHLNKHNGVYPFKCDECDFKSHNKFSLAAHSRRTGHNMEKVKAGPGRLGQRNKGNVLQTTVNTPYTFDCDHAGCDFKTSTHESLTHHIKRVHTTSSKANDPSATKRSNGHRPSQIQYDLVEDTGDGRVFKCPKCVCCFRNKNCITEHNRNNHSEGLPYQCPAKCGFWGVTEHSVKKHYGDWHKERNLACRIGCGKMFGKSESRNNHERRFCPLLDSKHLDQLKRDEEVKGVSDRRFHNHRKAKAKRLELLKSYNVPL